MGAALIFDHAALTWPSIVAWVASVAVVMVVVRGGRRTRGDD